MPFERRSGLIGKKPGSGSAQEELKLAAKERKRAKAKGWKGLEHTAKSAKSDILSGKKTYSTTGKKTAEWKTKGSKKHGYDESGEVRRKERARTARALARKTPERTSAAIKRLHRNVAHGS